MTIDAHIASMREDYSKAQLLESSVLPNPIDQFTIWWQQALEAQIAEPNAMTLCTVDTNHLPHSRIVLLKSFDSNGFVFFTNYNSHKGQHIAQNPNVSLQFFWQDLQRQVRITGQALKVDETISKAYFHSRPKASQIAAITSAQSNAVGSREALDNLFAQLVQQYEHTEVPYPNHWGGYIVQPQSIEFWQGRSNRLHDRLVYTKDNLNWVIQRLNP
jgi:pyridoxamine 5'-phosphate oxidase